MTWLVWRQFRGSALAAIAGLLVLGTWVWVSGNDLSDEYDAGMAGCSGQACDPFIDTFVDRHQAPLLALVLIAIVVPILLGLFWGAPLIARELDAGTHRLVWNQSVTRTRWLVVKLLVVGASCAAVVGLVVWWVDQWSTPLDLASDADKRLPMNLTYASSGVVPVAYALFAFALGVTVGMLTKRVLPALAITLVLFAGVQVAVAGWVRPHLAPTHTTTAPVTADGPRQLSMGPDGVTLSGDGPVKGSWVRSHHMVDGSGARIDVLPASLVDDPRCAPSPNDQDIAPCLESIAAQGYQQLSVYHLPSQTPRLKWTEAGLYGAATAGLVWFCFWWLRRRVA
jgi:hypothetical protein